MPEAGALVHIVASVVICAPLVYAAIAKLMEPSGFTAALSRLGIASRLVTPATVGAAELGIAALVILSGRFESAIAAAATYIVFAIVVERARSSGASGDCGCFGAIRMDIGRGAVLRNTVLGIGSLSLAVTRSSEALPAYEASVAIAGFVGCCLAAALLDTLLTVRATTS